MTVALASDQTKSKALQLRYGASEIPPAGPWNAHIDLLMSHRSVRGYRSDPVPEGTLETLVAAAQSAALGVPETMPEPDTERPELAGSLSTKNE